MKNLPRLVMTPNRSRRLLVPLVWLLLSFTAIRAGWADEGVVRFCFNAWPPYTEIIDGKPAGISVEILQEAATRSGLQASFIELPWNRCLQAVRDGALDAVIDAAKRDEFIQGPNSYSVYTNTFWVRKNDAINAFDLSQLEDYRIGLVSGYVYPDDLAAILRPPRYRIEYSVDDTISIRKLAYGRVDAIIADFVSTKVYAYTNGLEIRPLLPSHSFDRLYVSFGKTRAALQVKIDQAIATLIDDGFVAESYRSRFDVSFDDLLDVMPSVR